MSQFSFPCLFLNYGGVYFGKCPPNLRVPSQKQRDATKAYAAFLERAVAARGDVDAERRARRRG